MAASLLGRSYNDMSRLPTRIQDIPKDVLHMFGIVIDDNVDHFVAKFGMNKDEDDDNDDDDDDDEPGKLIIDEDVDQFMPKIDLCHQIFKKDKSEIKQVIQQFHITTSKSGEHAKNVNYCFLCKKVLDTNPAEHAKCHCFFEGCPELILTEAERKKHKKMHDHPTKPLQCKWCKKRYRYYSYVEKHYSFCKVYKKLGLPSKENCKKM